MTYLKAQLSQNTEGVLKKRLPTKSIVDSRFSIINFIYSLIINDLHHFQFIVFDSSFSYKLIFNTIDNQLTYGTLKSEI